MEIAVRALGGAITAYGAAYLLVGILNPGLFLDLLAVNSAERRGAPRWRVWLRIGLTIIGLGALMYCASYGIFQFVPLEWGGRNEDGDWEGTRDSFRAIFAGISTLMIVSSFEKRIEESHGRDILLAHIGALDNTIRFYANNDTKIRAEKAKRERMTDLEDRSKSNYMRDACQKEVWQIDRAIDLLGRVNDR